MNSVSISIVIATYNRLPLLREAIFSVFEQNSGTGPEVVVVDDGSSDGTAAWLRDLGERIKYRRLEHSGNLATVRNEGLAHASGDLVLFLDDDDLLEPGSISLLSTSLQRNPDAGFAFGDFRYFSGEQIGPPRLRGRWRGDKDAFWNLLAGTPLLLQATMLRRTLLEQVGGLDPSMAAAEDYDLCLRASSIANGIFISEPVARIRMQPDSMSKRNSVAGTQNAIASLERIRENEFLDQPHSAALRSNLSKLYANLGRMQSDASNFAMARRSIWKAFTANPISPRCWFNCARIARRSFRLR